MKKYFKEKKYQVIFFCLLIVFVLLLLNSIRESFFGYKGSVYGDRLEGIEEVEISKDLIKDVEYNLNKNEKVNDSKVTVRGRLVNLKIDIKENVDIIDIKQLSENSLKDFSDKIKEYYDFHFYITEPKQQKSEPLMGSKHKKNAIISWSR